ncbi:hypothetical protein Droror1_Dr00022425 [Drosera rotundifolia]
MKPIPSPMHRRHTQLPRSTPYSSTLDEETKERNSKLLRKSAQKKEGNQPLHQIRKLESKHRRFAAATRRRKLMHKETFHIEDLSAIRTRSAQTRKDDLHKRGKQQLRKDSQPQIRKREDLGEDFNHKNHKALRHKGELINNP